MNAADAINRQGTQAELAELVGVSEARISQLVSDGLIERGATLAQQLKTYCSWLREVAAGRSSGEAGGLDLVQERAALAREQRISQELKNQIARGEYAPVGLLADVLGQASSAVVDRFDQMEGAMRKACPDLPDEALSTVQTVLAGARNAWILATAKIVTDFVDEITVDDAEEETASLFDDDPKGIE